MSGGQIVSAAQNPVTQEYNSVDTMPVEELPVIEPTEPAQADAIPVEKAQDGAKIESADDKTILDGSLTNVEPQLQDVPQTAPQINTDIPGTQKCDNVSDAAQSDGVSADDVNATQSQQNLQIEETSNDTLSLFDNNSLGDIQPEIGSIVNNLPDVI